MWLLLQDLYKRKTGQQETHFQSNEINQIFHKKWARWFKKTLPQWIFRDQHQWKPRTWISEMVNFGCVLEFLENFVFDKPAVKILFRRLEWFQLRLLSLLKRCWGSIEQMAQYLSKEHLRGCLQPSREKECLNEEAKGFETHFYVGNIKGKSTTEKRLFKVILLF